MKYKIWDKTESINNISAEKYIEKNKISENEEVFLLYKHDTNKVDEVVLKSNIIRVYNLEPNLSCEEVAQKYIDIIQNHNLNNNFGLLLEQQGEKISILEAENKSLKEGLQAILRGDMQSLAYALYPEDFIKEIPEL